MDEAMHPLAFMSVGMYGKQLLPQNGAPMRLVVPWKYGFKSVKSINKIVFSETMPNTAWNDSAPQEYGFYANVNPDVHHPRWLQSRERPLGSFRSRILSCLMAILKWLRCTVVWIWFKITKLS